jgi:hypothetical protein
VAAGGARLRSPPMVEAAPARSTGVRAATVAMVVAAVAGIAAFAWFRIWQARVGNPLVWQDSLQYAALGRQPLLSHRIWAGARPPVTPLLWKVAGSDTAFVLAQTLVSVAAWSILAVVAACRVRPWWGRLVAGAAVLGFATTRPVTQWDRSVLSESLSLALVALLFAVVILWGARPTLPRALGVIAIGLLFAATRDTQIWVMALVAVAFGAYAAWRGLRVDATSARPALVVAAGLVGVVVLTGAGSVASHREVQNVENALAVRVFPYPSRIAWFGDHGMPQAARLTRLAKAKAAEPGQAPVVTIDPADPSFRALTRWMHSDAVGTYVRWLLFRPETVLTEPLLRPERSFNNADGHLSFYAAADRTDAPVLTTILYPAWPWVLFAAFVAVAGGVYLGLHRRPDWSLIALLGALGLVHMLIAWHGDGMEATRHASVGNVQVRLGVLLLLVLLLDGRRQASVEAAAEAVADQPLVSISPS